MNLSIQNEINNELDSLAGKSGSLAGPAMAQASENAYLSLSANASDSIDQTAHDVDFFYRFLPIDQLDFVRTYGYELWIVDAKTNTPVVKYPFPINPQSINENAPAAGTLEATMKGVYETHNGAPFRPISITGTTGTNPISSPGASPKAQNDVRRSLEYAFKNTIKSFNSVVNQANKTLHAFQGATQKFSGPLNYQVTVDETNLSGYQTIHDLSRFLDYYLAAKKLSQNRSWRLYFIQHKDRKYYACKLDNYSIVKAPGTTEYSYTINMTAYRRDATIPYPGSAKRFISAANAAASANTLSNILNALQEARRTLAAANGVLSGIRSDINDSLIRPVGEAVLLIKDIAGTAKNMYDFAFSGQTLKSMEESFKQYWTDLKNDQSMQAVAAAIKNLGLIGAIGANGFAVSAIVTSAQSKLASGKAEQFQNNQDTSDPTSSLFDNPANHPDIFESFPIDSMNLPVEVSDQLDTLTANVLNFTAQDIITRRNTVVDFSRSISEALGGGSTSYNAVLGLNSVKKTFKKLTVDDVNLLNQLNDIAINLDRLAVLLDQADNNNREDYYQFYSDYAISQGLRFSQSSLSRFFVPFPMGGSLEQLAAQYLGTPDRWIEIAALNALKAPYVDEVGYDILVTASAGGDTLTIADPQNLFVGQVVRIQSDTQPVTIRKIESIDIVSAVETIVTFVTSTGSPLTIYKPSQNARIHAFMPNTINSDMLVAIPSDVPPTFATTLKTSPEIDELNGIARIAKVDFLLDSSGDLIFTGGGDIRLAYGMTNLVQAAILKLKTGTKTIINLPGYGNPVKAGMNTADASAQQILKALQQSFSSDPRFGGILAGEVQKTGPSVNVSILVSVQDTKVTLPIAAEIPR